MKALHWVLLIAAGALAIYDRVWPAVLIVGLVIFMQHVDETSG